MSEEVKGIDYIDALMTIFIDSPHISPGLKKQINALRISRRKEMQDDELVSLPIKRRILTEEEIYSVFEGEENNV